MAERKREEELIRVKSDEQLLRVVRDVVRSSEAASVDVENVGQVTISPIPPTPRKPRKKMTLEEREAKRDRIFQSAAGSWKDVDTDKLWAEIKAARGQKARSWMQDPSDE
jgi:hypothetical protein